MKGNYKLKELMLSFILIFSMAAETAVAPIQVKAAQDDIQEDEIEFVEVTDYAVFEDKEGNVVSTSQDSPIEVTYGDFYTIFVKSEEGTDSVEAISKENFVSVEKEAVSSKEGYEEFTVKADKVIDNVVTVTFEKIVGTEKFYTDFYVKTKRKVLNIDTINARLSYHKIYDGDLRVFNNDITQDIVTFDNLPIIPDDIVYSDVVYIDTSVIPSGFEGEIKEELPLNYSENPQETGISFWQSQLVLVGEDSRNYVLEEKEITVPSSVAVKKRKVQVIVSDAAREYGHALNNNINNNINYIYDSKQWVSIQQQPESETDTTEGIISSDTDFAVPEYEEALLENVNNKSVPGKYPEVLDVDIAKFWSEENKNKYDNYDFVITKGDLTILKESIQEDPTEYLDLSDNEENTTMHIQENRKVWVRAEEGILKLNANTDKLYDTVWLSKIDDVSVTSVNLTENGYKFMEQLEGESREKKLTLYLYNSATGVMSQEFCYSIYLDGSIPTVTIKTIRGPQTTLDKLLDSVTFGNFGRTEYTADITVERDETTSGLNRWQYAVLPLTKDIDNGEELQNYMDEMQINGKLVWSEEETVETKSITVSRKDTADANFMANNYVILVKTYDNVENSKVFTSMGFILDSTDPIVEIKLADGQQTKPVYNDSVYLQAIVSDSRKSFNKEESKIQEEISGIKNVYYQIAEGRENLNDAKKIYLYEAGTDKVYSLDELQNEVMVLTKDKSGKDFVVDKKWNSNNIWVRVTAADNSGNTYPTYMQLKIDTIKPTVTVNYETEATEEYAPYYNRDCTAVITIRERNINTEDINQLYFNLKREKDTGFTKCNLESLKSGYGEKIMVESVTDSQHGKEKWQFTDDRTVIIRVKFVGEDKYNFDVKCIDEAGLADGERNVAYFIIDKTVPKLKVSYTVDKTKPALAVSIKNLSQTQNGIFNENVTLQIDAEDFMSGETYSGLESVWYTIWASGNVIQNETVEVLNNSSNKVQGNRKFSKVITVPADVYNSNNVKIQAFAVDYAGNQGCSEEINLKIDITAPVITVSWDLNHPLNNKYYNETRTATVTVAERNFNSDNVKFSITNTDGASAKIGKWTRSNVGNSDSAVNTCQVSFHSDGDYTFTVQCTDLAGNIGEYGKTDEFTIDKTLPVLSVSYDNNNARNGKYYKEKRTATVTVREHNFNAADVKAAITASLEGNTDTAPSISGFSNTGDVHIATINYTKDGDYTFGMEYTDMAGNKAVVYTEDNFIIDLTAPEVEIVDIKDKSANNDVVSPGIKAADINYDARNVSMNVTGINNGTVNMDKTVSAIRNGQYIKLKDFPRTEKVDDLYRLTAKAVDMAGNETEKVLLFSVNRYGSVYVLDKDTDRAKGGWLSSNSFDYTYINQEKEVGIIEYNVDTIKNCRITVNRDGELENLEEKKDYTVTSAGSEVRWKEKHYKIKANNFSKEGNYTIILQTQDKADNTMNNNSMRKSGGKLPITFTVDKTAPTVVVSGIEDGGRYHCAEKNIIVDAKDNLALSQVTVNVNGNEMVYTAEELKDENGIMKEIQIPVISANNWQEIKISAEDMAGNIIGQTERDKMGQPVTLRILITPNILIQYYMNKPLFFGSIVGILMIFGIIIVVFRKHILQK